MQNIINDVKALRIVKSLLGEIEGIFCFFYCLFKYSNFIYRIEFFFFKCDMFINIRSNFGEFASPWPKISLHVKRWRQCRSNTICKMKILYFELRADFTRTKTTLASPIGHLLNYNQRHLQYDFTCFWLRDCNFFYCYWCLGNKIKIQ